MITMAQRIEALRVEKGLSRPQLSAALGLPRSAMEKFETGRQTPTPGSAEEAGGLFRCLSVLPSRGERRPYPGWSPGLSGAVDEPPAPPRPAVPAPRLHPAPQGRMVPCSPHF